MRYLILGNGFMGNKFKDYLGSDAFISKTRIECFRDLKDELLEKKPTIVINCIGKSGTPNVDWCEDHKDETYFSNVTVPTIIAETTNELGTYWVHLSSGCIYEGNNHEKGFSETDPPNFTGSFYSRTKAWSESILKQHNNILIARLRMPVDNIPSRRNLIDKLIGYGKIAMVENSMSYIPDFLKSVKILMDKKRTGTYNLVNPGKISLEEIIIMYQEIVDPNFKYEKLSLEELNNITIAKRSNCVLNVKKTLNEGIKLPHIKEAVKEALNKYKTHPSLITNY